MPIIGGFFGLFKQPSNAESQKRKYAEVIEEINVQLEKTIYLDEQMELLRSDYNVMECNPDSAEGKIRTTYEDKETDNRQAMETLYSDLSTAISEIKSQLSEVQSQYEYWCSEVEREKQQLLNFEESDE